MKALSGMEVLRAERDVFEHEEFGRVRALMRDGEPWFVGNDVARALGYARPKDAVAMHCKYAELFKGGDLPPLTSSPRGLHIIPEPDVYALIFHSRLPAAERFRAWVYEQVLPSLRKRGGCGLAGALEQAALELGKARAALDGEMERRKLAEEEEYFRTREASGFGRNMLAHGGAISVHELGRLMRQASGGELGARKAFKWLRAHGWLNRRGNARERCLPTQRAIDKGYMRVAVREEEYRYNGNVIRQRWAVAQVTPKGQRYFLEQAMRLGGAICAEANQSLAACEEQGRDGGDWGGSGV